MDTAKNDGSGQNDMGQKPQGEINPAHWLDKKGQLLAVFFVNDFNTALNNLSEELSLEFTDHVLRCLDLGENYLKNPSHEYWEPYKNHELEFLKKHGNQLSFYRQLKMYLYFGSDLIFAEKSHYFNVVWDNVPLPFHAPTQSDFFDFITYSRKALEMRRDYLLLERGPMSPKTSDSTKATETDTKRLSRGKVERGPKDNFTCLNQEQTVLLLYYLQHERAFLKDEYLTGQDAGRAFEILTGYSQHTLRQKLSKFNLYQTPENLKTLSQFLNRVLLAINND